MIGLWVTLALAADIEVPADAPTLADAIALAAPGDRVLLATGRHEAGVRVPLSITITGSGDDTVLWTDAPGVPVLTIAGATSVELGGFTVESVSRGLVIESDATVTVDGLSAVELDTDGSGAAIYATDAELHVTGGRYVGNRAGAGGGAIAVEGGTLLIEGALFTGNHAESGGGGAVLATGSGLVTLRGAVFEENLGPDGGGAVQTDGPDLVVEDSTFARNESSFGGAIRQRDGDLTLLRTLVEGYAEPAPPSDGLVRVDVTGTVTVEDSELRGGRTGFYGGAMDVVSAEAIVLRGSRFEDNETGWSGSAVRVVSSPTVEIEDCVFAGNRILVPLEGGTVRVEQGRTLSVSRSTFAENTGGGLGAVALTEPSSALVVASAFSDNSESPEATLQLDGFASLELEGNVFDRNRGGLRGAVAAPDAGSFVSVRNRYCRNVGDVPALYTSASSFGTVNDLVVANVGTDGVFVVFRPSAWTATNSTFLDNVAAEGGVLHATSGILSVDNSIFAWNDVEAAIYADAPSFPVVSDDLFFENTGAPLGGDLADVIAFDPDRMLNGDPGYADYAPEQLCEAMRPWPTLESPLVDAGSDFDLDGSAADLGYTGGAGADPALWADDDGDGFVVLFDCDDTRAEAYPGADETCNALDDDCDGVVDEDPVDAPPWFLDIDGDTWGGPERGPVQCDAPPGHVDRSGDCDDSDAAVSPGADERCNDIDDDCDGVADQEGAVDAPARHRDADGDSWGDPELARYTCEPLDGYVDDGTDCDDTDPEVNPAAEERCNGIDDDCDRTTDEPDAVDAAVWFLDGDGDGFGDAELPTVACAAPPDHVADAGDCDDAEPAVNPGADERCNGVDDDCDGTTDEPDAVDAATWFPDADGDGYGDLDAPVEACEPPDGHVESSGDCDDTEPLAWVGADEVCDEVDNDCDGVTDGPDALDAVEWWPDADGDGWGVDGETVLACSQPEGCAAQPGDCDDEQASVSPDADEIPGNGIDDDCDGLDAGVDDTDPPTAVDTGSSALTSPRDAGGVDTDKGGCGCSTSAGGVGLGWLLLPLVLVWRRRC